MPLPEFQAQCMIPKIFTTPAARFTGHALASIFPLWLVYAGDRLGRLTADLPGTGPGLYIALMNERTLRAQGLWHFVDAHRWLIPLYAMLMAITLGVLSTSRLPRLYRWLWWGIAAMPGCWYFRETSYLGLKVLSFH